MRLYVLNLLANATFMVIFVALVLWAAYSLATGIKELRDARTVEIVCSMVPEAKGCGS